MLAETQDAIAPGEGSGQGEIEREAKGAQRPARARGVQAPCFVPLYIEHKKKVPMLTLEVQTDGLNPLQRRALERLPRVQGVPVIRALAQADGLGFAFQFRIDPKELTAEAVPELLQRWDEKFELAKARAGLEPKPAPKAEPLKPRSPRRKKECDEEGGDEAAAGEGAKADMRVIDAAIAAHDAKTYAGLVRAGAGEGAQAQELDDPLGSTVQAGQEGQADPADLEDRNQARSDLAQDERPHETETAADAESALAEKAVASQASAGASELPTLPPEYALLVSSVAPARRRTPGRTDGAMAAAQKRASPAAVAAQGGPKGAGAQPAAGHGADAGEPAEREPFAELPLIRLADAGGDTPPVHWRQSDNGQIWSALCHLELEPGPGHTVAARLKLLPLPEPAQHPSQAAAALAQSQAQSWLEPALAHLNKALFEAMKTARIPVPGRRAHLSAAMAELPRWLETLQALLLDMERAAQIRQRIERHLLAMPEWAITVHQTLTLERDWHAAYLRCASFYEAVALVNRWCAPMSALRLTRQIGLFADPQALNLQRQLAHLVEHAKAWSSASTARADSARVLAAWVDSAHQHTCATQKA